MGNSVRQKGCFYTNTKRMTASPLPGQQSQQSSYQWRTETTRTNTQPNGETWRTETIRTNQQPQSHSTAWRTESQTGGGPVTTGQTSWRTEKRTTTTTERQTIPIQQTYTTSSRDTWNTQRTAETGSQLGGRPGSRADSAASFQYSRGDKINPGEQRLSQLTRPDSRASVTASDHGSVVNDTLNALATDVEQTTEIIRRKQQQMRSERRQFQTEMEVTGRISISPTDDWLNARLKAVSTDDLKRDLSKIKEDQRTNAVTDTLAALVYDVNATAEVLRRGSLGRDRGKKKDKAQEEVEYRLRLTPSVDEEPRPFPSPKQYEQVPEEKTTVDDMQRDFGVDISESHTASLRRRARSETPRRTLHIEPSPPPMAPPICAYCDEEIDGQILTALAPNSERAQKFHTYHFMCTYCQKALNMHGTYREHDRKPYCHDCFYKLYNGLQYCPDEHQKQIDKLI